MCKNDASGKAFCTYGNESLNYWKGSNQWDTKTHCIVWEVIVAALRILIYREKSPHFFVKLDAKMTETSY